MSQSPHEETPALQSIYNYIQLPQEDGVAYPWLELEGRLTWRKHIFAKRKQLGMMKSAAFLDKMTPCGSCTKRRLVGIYLFHFMVFCVL
jgi:hypothetical protein